MIMYSISFFNESLAEWTGCGEFPFTDIEDARARMRELSIECNRSVSFRIVQLPTAE